MRSFHGLISVLVLVLSTAAFGSTGDAGCGLGSLIISKNTKVSQTLALTTNATSWSQLFGITSGTSNCSAKGFVKNEAETQYYAEANLPSLKVDMARGSGESLAAFGQLMGCTQSDMGAFSHAAQSKFSALFPSDNVSASDFVSAANRELGSICTHGV